MEMETEEPEVVIRVSVDSARKTLELIALLDAPMKFAKLLDHNLKSETIEEDIIIKQFLQKPHAVVSGYNSDTIFFNEETEELIVSYVKSLVDNGVRVEGDYDIFQKRIERMNERLKVNITGDKVKKFLLPAMLLTKLPLKFETPSLVEGKYASPWTLPRLGHLLQDRSRTREYP